MTADELEVVSVEGEEVCPDTSRTQCEEYVVQHSLDFRLAAGLESEQIDICVKQDGHTRYL